MMNTETWADWHPEQPATLRFDDLIARVNARGYKVNQITIQYWQKAGFLPAPIKRNLGAPGKTFAHFPEIAVDYIVAILEWQKVPSVERLRRHMRKVRAGMSGFTGLDRALVNIDAALEEVA